MWQVWASCGILLWPIGVAGGAVPIAAVGDAGQVARTTDPERALDDRLAASMRGDAELAAVCFAGSQHGWAVGDRGVIWHTSNAGRQWDQQEAGVTCRLSDVTFIDATTGWAVGGATRPYLQTSHGVVLRTRDGGAHWTRVGGPLLPALTTVKFLDSRRGMAIGRPCEIFPSGVFLTEDGGRSWVPVPFTTSHHWLVGDLVDPSTGAFAGHAGTLAVFRRGCLQPAQSPPLAPRSCRDLRLLPPARGWLVGDGGLLLATSDLGQSWQLPAGQLGASATSYFDFCTVTAHGLECWVAGSPGSRVFHTADGGATWSAYATGSSVPIRDLIMLDSGRGWAVGGLGTILATEDGGRTWTRQRAGGERAALLTFCAQPSELPLELFAQLSAEGGYLGVAALIGRPTAEGATAMAWHERAHEAVVAVGGCGAEAAWQFPIRSAALRLPRTQLVRDFDRANEGRGLQRLNATVVRAIRTWRPAVVFVSGGHPEGDPPMAGLLQQSVLAAVTAAADPSQYSDMTTDAGLPPWSVKRVFGILPGGTTEGVRIHTGRLAPRLGRSLANHTSQPRGLISAQYDEVPSVVAFRPLVDRARRGGRQPSFFEGISFAAGGPARRTPPDAPVQTIDQLKRMVEKHRNVRGILQQQQHNPAYLAQIGNLTSGLNPRSAGHLLYQLGQQYIVSGQAELAVATFDRLEKDYPHHPLTEVAQAWLLRYHASGEAAWQTTLHGAATPASAATAIAVERFGSSAPANRLAGPKGRPSAVLPASGTAASEAGLPRRWTRAVEIGQVLERRAPVLFADPRVRFPLAVAQRRSGSPVLAQQLFMTLYRSHPRDVWWTCAAAERWLAEPKGTPPKPIWSCRRAAARPHLDGHLDEPLWKQAEPVDLKSLGQDDALWPASARLAYDGDYLYLAVECHKAPGATYPVSAAPRPRDPDLSAHDRLDLMIDIDRDYATYYRLTVDHRGWTGEACLADATWNPTWYVAAYDEPEKWTVEAAVPWRELHAEAPEPGLAWAVGAQRIVPGVGFQAWTQPAGLDVVVPEGFGLLLLK